MALTLKKFNSDLQRRLRIIALEQNPQLTLCQLIEKWLVESIERYQWKKKRGG